MHLPKLYKSFVKVIIWDGRDESMHLWVGKLTTIDSDNGLSPDRRQFIIWTNAGILLIWLFGKNFCEKLIKINIYSFNEMHLKVPSAKCPAIAAGQLRGCAVWCSQDFGYFGPLLPSWTPPKLNWSKVLVPGLRMCHQMPEIYGLRYRNMCMDFYHGIFFVASWIHYISPDGLV